jgi:acyl carrier protein
MTREEISKKVQTVIAEKRGVDLVKVVPEARLVEDLGADSLDVCEIVMEIEDEVHIVIDDEDVENLKTVGELTTYAAKKAGVE